MQKRLLHCRNLFTYDAISALFFRSDFIGRGIPSRPVAIARGGNEIHLAVIYGRAYDAHLFSYVPHLSFAHYDATLIVVNRL